MYVQRQALSGLELVQRKAGGSLYQGSCSDSALGPACAGPTTFTLLHLVKHECSCGSLVFWSG
jgi:hypothetical protein